MQPPFRIRHPTVHERRLTPIPPPAGVSRGVVHYRAVIRVQGSSSYTRV